MTNPNGTSTEKLADLIIKEEAANKLKDQVSHQMAELDERNLKDLK